MSAGRIETLLILGGNPVFNAPADLEFAEQLQRVPLRVHLGLYQDETAAECDWHLPESHFLEAWGDARAFDGTASIQQPLIAPLYNGLSALEVLSALFEPAGRSGYEIVRDYWRRNWPQSNSGGDFEAGWNRALHDGLIAGTAVEPRTNLKVSPSWKAGILSACATSHPNLEIAFATDPTIFDGRFANNGWLQELPKPITKLTWDNAVLISPKLAEQLGITQRVGINGGEHGQSITDLVELEAQRPNVASRGLHCSRPRRELRHAAFRLRSHGRRACRQRSWLQCVQAANICRAVVFDGRENSQAARRVHAGLHAGASFDGRSRSRSSVHLRSIQAGSDRSFYKIS